MVTSAPALKPIDYTSDRPVYLSVDTSIHGIGFILSQEDEQGRRAPARYGSLPLKEPETRYGQSKLELYGLFRALRHYRAFVVGVKNFIVEVDASSIKGMLDNPDIQASAVINRWIQGIQQFDFQLIHVPAYKHKGPDAPSRRRFETQDHSGESDPEEWVDNIALYAQLQSPDTFPQTPEEPFNQINDTLFMDFLSPQRDDLKTVWSGTAAHQSGEDELNNILRYLVTGQDPQLRRNALARFKRKAQQFFLQGVHMYRRQNGSSPQVVIFNRKR